jgi:uncharacterized membrane protein YkgB
VADNRILTLARANPYGATVLTAAVIAFVTVAVTRPDNWGVMLALAGFLILSGAVRLRETARGVRQRDD